MLNTELVAPRDLSRNLWLVGCCAFTSMMSMRICDAMLPALASSFDVSPGQAAGAISGFALAYGLLQLFYGPLGDRYGKLRVIASATLACVVGNAVAALSPDLEWLIFARVLSGAAAAGVIPLTMAWIGDSVAYEERQHVLARLLGATVFGMIGGQWLGGLISETWGWPSAFAALAVVFALAGTMLAVHSDARAGATQRAPSHGFLKSLRAVTMRPWARSVLIVTTIEGAFAFSALAFIPSELHQRFGLSTSRAGALVALYGLGGFVYTRCARPLLKRLGEPGLAKLGGLGLLTAYVGIAVAPFWLWVPPACLLAGFSFYCLHSTLQTHATQMAPDMRGTAVSLFACFLFLGQSIGVALAALVVDRWSARAVFLASGIGLAVLGFRFAAAIRKRALA